MNKTIVIFAGLILALFIATSCGSDEPKNIVETDNIDSLVMKYPDSVEILIRHGRFYSDNYKYKKALPSAAKAFRLDSNNLDARLLYAHVMNNKMDRTVEEVMTARRHFAVVHKAQPKNLEALVSLASTYSYVEDFETSFQYLNEALRMNPKYRDAYVMKGTNYMRIGKTDLAKSSYETAVQQDPEFYEGYLFLGALYQSEGNPICTEYYITATKIKPDDLELQYSLAYAYQEMGQYDKAKETYRHMRTMDSTYAMPVFQLGYIKQFYEDDIDSAMVYYNQAIVMEPRFVEAWHNLGYCHELKSDRLKALAAYSKALKYNPNFEKSREAADRLR